MSFIRQLGRDLVEAYAYDPDGLGSDSTFGPGAADAHGSAPSTFCCPDLNFDVDAPS